jgi:hypothetical protein
MGLGFPQVNEIKRKREKEIELGKERIQIKRRKGIHKKTLNCLYWRYTTNKKKTD